MGRMVKDWKPDLVASAEVAPHRYLWSGAIRPDGEPAKELVDCTSFKDRRANVPYAEGEVVYVERSGEAVKARIYVVLTTMRDRYGDPREAYKVQVATASGHWSKLWEMAHPGFIQRGYKRAGLAPDVPD